MPRYHMKKKEREIIDPEEMHDILRRGKFVVISLCRDNEPYIVTLNYGYDEGPHRLYVHTAPAGLKLDFIRANPHVCGTVIDDLGYMPGECNHRYRSVVFWGRIAIVEDLEEKKHGMDVLLRHLEDDPQGVRDQMVSDDDIYRNVAILRLDIDEITGKKGG